MSTRGKWAFSAHVLNGMNNESHYKALSFQFFVTAECLCCWEQQSMESELENEGEVQSGWVSIRGIWRMGDGVAFLLKGTEFVSSIL